MTKKGCDQLTAVGDCLHSKGIKPVFCFSRLASTVLTSGETIRKKSGFAAFVDEWLLDRRTVDAPQQPQFYTAFMGVCLRNQWQVII